MSSVPSPGEYYNNYEYYYKKKVEILNHIEIIISLLNKFTICDPIITCLSYILNSDKCHYKRKKIAEAVEDIVNNKDLHDQKDQLKIVKQFKDDIFNSKSVLYRALNDQTNFIFRFTFFGAIHPISWNCAKSLQLAQSVIMKEKNTIEMDTIKLYK